MRRGTELAAGLLTAAVAAAGLRRGLFAPGSATSWAPPAGVVVPARLVTRVVGDGAPQVVLLHGLFNSGRYWGRAYDDVAAEGTVVVPDLLGFGRSPKPPTGYTADAHADAVADTLRQVGVVRPVVVGAHSVGSVVALRLAVRHPGLVTAVVAFAPPIYRDPAAARRQLARTDPLARVLVLNEAVARRMCSLMCRYHRVAASVVKVTRPTLPGPLAEDRVEHSWASYHETLANLIIAAEVPAWLQEVQVPVRLVAGDADRTLDIDLLTDLAAARSNLSLEIVAGGGHDLPLSHPAVCVDALRRSTPAAINGTGAPA